MAIQKQNLNNFLPNGFETENKEGYKTNFSDDKITTGFQKDTADIFSGPNLNNMLDVIGKNTNTLNSYVDYLNQMAINKTPIIDANNNLNHTQIGLKVYYATETYLLDDLVTAIVDEKVKIFRSLTNNNLGNAVDNEDYWQEVSLGGGGLEVGDIGISLFIDESKGLRRYLNGQEVAINKNTQAFLNKIKQIAEIYPSLVCDDNEWRQIASTSVGGQCGKFVIDETAGIIRLPKIIMPIQGLTDLSKLGEIVEAGLPTHNHTKGSMRIEGSLTGVLYGSTYSKSGALKWRETAVVGGGGSENAVRGVILDTNEGGWTGSTSAPNDTTYGKSNTVQQEQIQYPYFIQIATGQELEVDIENEVQLNNPYSLGDSKYSPIELNNLSWLISDGSYNGSYAVYPTFYNEYVGKIGEDFGLGKIKNHTDSDITDYDLVFNQSNMTFRLPLLDGSEDLPSDRYEDLTLLSSGSTYTAKANGWFVFSKKSSAIDQFVYMAVKTNTHDSIQVSRGSTGNNHTIEQFIPVRKNDTVIISYNLGGTTNHLRLIYAKGNGSLYYYVGETVQNANLINAGRIQEHYATKDFATMASFPSSRYIDLTLGASGSRYIAPANGWVAIAVRPTTAGHSISIGGGSLVVNNRASAATVYTSCYLPIIKGYTFSVSYDGNPTKEFFRFVYAEGEQ